MKANVGGAAAYWRNIVIKDVGENEMLTYINSIALSENISAL